MIILPPNGATRIGRGVRSRGRAGSVAPSARAARTSTRFTRSSPASSGVRTGTRTPAGKGKQSGTKEAPATSSRLGNFSRFKGVGPLVGMAYSRTPLGRTPVVGPAIGAALRGSNLRGISQSAVGSAVSNLVKEITSLPLAGIASSAVREAMSEEPAIAENVTKSTAQTLAALASAGLPFASSVPFSAVPIAAATLTGYLANKSLDEGWMGDAFDSRRNEMDLDALEEQGLSRRAAMRAIADDADIQSSYSSRAGRKARNKFTNPSVAFHDPRADNPTAVSEQLAATGTAAQRQQSLAGYLSSLGFSASDLKGAKQFKGSLAEARAYGGGLGGYSYGTEAYDDDAYDRDFGGHDDGLDDGFAGYDDNSYDIDYGYDYGFDDDGYDRDYGGYDDGLDGYDDGGYDRDYGNDDDGLDGFGGNSDDGGFGDDGDDGGEADGNDR